MANEVFHQINKARINKGLKVKDLLNESHLSFQSWISLRNNSNYTTKMLSKLCKTLEIKEITLKF